MESGRYARAYTSDQRGILAVRRKEARRQYREMAASAKTQLPRPPRGTATVLCWSPPLPRRVGPGIGAPWRPRPRRPLPKKRWSLVASLSCNTRHCGAWPARVQRCLPGCGRYTPGEGAGTVHRVCKALPRPRGNRARGSPLSLLTGAGLFLARALGGRAEGDAAS